jgi:hypothetical protein
MKKFQKQQSKTAKFLFAGVILLLAFGQLKAQDDYIKRYPIESAKVTYNVKSPDGNGTKVLIFDNYGKRQSVHETLKKHGKVIKDNLILFNNDKSYIVDLLENTAIDQSEISGMAMNMVKGMGGDDMSASGKKVLESMGGKQIGNESFLGKNCEKWQVNTMGKTTMLIWKGIPLKTESRVFGIKSLEEATSIKTGLSFSDSDFEPPAGIKIENTAEKINESMEISDEDREQMRKLQNMSYSEYKSILKKDNPNLTDEEIKQSYELMKKLGKIFN